MMDKSRETTNDLPADHPLVEATSLRRCRWGFMLLAANLMLQLAFYLLAALTTPLPQDEDTKPVHRTPPLGDYAMSIGTTLLTLPPGALLLYSIARSSRWRRASAGLAILAGAELCTVVALALWRQHDVVLTAPEPLQVRVLLSLLDLIGWMNLWNILVLAAEFFISTKQQPIVERTELLGYLVLGGIALSLASAGWMLPVPPTPGRLDGFDLLLDFAREVSMLVTLLWSVQLLSFAATLARMMAQKASQQASQPGSSN